MSAISKKKKKKKKEKIPLFWKFQLDHLLIFFLVK